MRGDKLTVNEYRFFLSYCAASFWLNGFTLTELSEVGLFNGVLSIHEEFECRLLVCLHDGLAAEF